MIDILNRNFRKRWNVKWIETHIEKGDGILVNGPLNTRLRMLCEFASTLRRILAGAELLAVQVFVTVTDIGGGRLVGIAVFIRRVNFRNGSHRVADET